MIQGAPLVLVSKIPKSRNSNLLLSHNSVIISSRNVEQLTNACAELIDNKDLRTSLGKAARRFVREKFRHEKMVDTVQGIYEKLLETKAL